MVWEWNYYCLPGFPVLPLAEIGPKPLAPSQLASEYDKIINV